MGYFGRGKWTILSPNMMRFSNSESALGIFLLIFHNEKGAKMSMKII